MPSAACFFFFLRQQKIPPSIAHVYCDLLFQPYPRFQAYIAAHPPQLAVEEKQEHFYKMKGVIYIANDSLFKQKRS